MYEQCIYQCTPEGLHVALRARGGIFRASAYNCRAHSRVRGIVVSVVAAVVVAVVVRPLRLDGCARASGVHVITIIPIGSVQPL